MPKGFRPILVPPAHRRAKKSPHRPILCLTVTSVAVLFVVIVFGVTSWSVYEHRFGKNTFVFHSRDEVALSQVASDFSVTFCDSYKVSLLGLGEVFLLPHHATVNTSFSDNMDVELYQLAYREFNVRYTYLLRKSSVNVTACRNGGPISSDAEIVFIQGDNNFRKWKRNNFCDDCVLKRTHIPDDAYCGSGNRSLPRLFHEVATNDRYFLLVFNGRPARRHHLLYGGIFLKGTFSRTHFDLSDTKEICHIVNDSTCEFELPWLSSLDLVVRFAGQGWIDLITRCQKRIIFWVCLFGILPFLCIFLTLTLFGCFLCKQAGRSSRLRCCQRGTKEERAKLLQENDKHFTNQVAQNEENGIMAIQFSH